VEALGQHVHQEAPDELVRVKPHGLPAVRAVDAVVLPAERHAALVEGEQTLVGDGDAVRVAADVVEDLFRSGKRRLGVDDPCDRRSPGKENGDVM
jgi:hypothetical protein